MQPLHILSYWSTKGRWSFTTSIILIMTSQFSWRKTINFSANTCGMHRQYAGMWQVNIKAVFRAYLHVWEMENCFPRYRNQTTMEPQINNDSVHNYNFHLRWFNFFFKVCCSSAIMCFWPCAKNLTKKRIFLCYPILVGFLYSEIQKTILLNLNSVLGYLYNS